MLWAIPIVFFGLAVNSIVASGSGHGDYVVSTDYTSRYHGPGATPVVLPDGTLADNPEVAAARSSHLVALQKAQALLCGNSGSSYGGHTDSHSNRYSQQSGKGVYSPLTPSSYVVSTDYNSRYHGPGATPVVLPDGTLANTPEVAAARAAHLAALQKAQALWYGNAGNSHGEYGSNSGLNYGIHSERYAGSGPSHGGAMASYRGPLASVTVLPSGYLADSSDVAASKVAHLGAVAQTYAEAAKWPAESGHNKGWN